jgi:hypothetical protein
MKGTPRPPSYPTIASIICGPNLTIGVSHRSLAIYIQKYVKGKRRIMKTQILHHAKNIIFKKNPLKETNLILQAIIITL